MWWYSICDSVTGAIAEIGDGTTIGETIAFETEPAVEVVTTENVDGISGNEAELQGELKDLENVSEAQVFFQYRETTEMENQTTEPETLTEPQSFAATVDGLEEETSYIGRAVATSDTDDLEEHGAWVGWETDDDGILL